MSNLRKENYQKLRSAGFSSQEANNYKDHSKSKIKELCVFMEVWSEKQRRYLDLKESMIRGILGHD